MAHRGSGERRAHEPELLRVASRDGHSAEARLFLPPRPRAAILWLPAMGVPARTYDRFASFLAGEGVAVLVGELRGGGTSSVRPRRGVDFGYSELLADADPLLELLATRTGLTVHFGGHSLGGQLSLLQLPRRGTPSTRLIIVAGGTTFFPSWAFPRNLGVLVGSQLAGLVATALGYFPGHRLGFGGLQPRTLIQEWARVGWEGRYRALGSVDLEAGLAALAPEVLAVHIEGDLLAPPAAMKGLLAKLPRARIAHVEAPAPVDPVRVSPHFRWMREPEPAAAHVARFLLAR